jgi:hypothetical protein
LWFYLIQIFVTTMVHCPFLTSYLKRTSLPLAHSTVSRMQEGVWELESLLTIGLF